MKTVKMVVLAIAVGALSCSNGDGDPCELEDQDGIVGGEKVFVLRVRDDGFDPPILKAQNRSSVTLTLRNEGTSDAGFSVDCLRTPNDDGCPTESCLPAAHAIEPIAAGESATVEFRLPEVEGEYIYRALPDDDLRTGQLIIL